mmetsp:Transcript_9305/g.30718  ORF Transcript_9305/g.30718 Transcript_9305/m.30718 type:complete len:200 (-) Transcript_9305:1457-2056(-)
MARALAEAHVPLSRERAHDAIREAGWRQVPGAGRGGPPQGGVGDREARAGRCHSRRPRAPLRRNPAVQEALTRLQVTMQYSGGTLKAAEAHAGAAQGCGAAALPRDFAHARQRAQIARVRVHDGDAHRPDMAQRTRPQGGAPTTPRAGRERVQARRRHHAHRRNRGQHPPGVHRGDGEDGCGQGGGAQSLSIPSNLRGG